MAIEHPVTWNDLLSVVAFAVAVIGGLIGVIFKIFQKKVDDLEDKKQSRSGCETVTTEIGRRLDNKGRRLDKIDKEMGEQTKILTKLDTTIDFLAKKNGFTGTG